MLSGKPDAGDNLDRDSSFKDNRYNRAVCDIKLVSIKEKYIIHQHLVVTLL